MIIASLTYVLEYSSALLRLEQDGADHHFLAPLGYSGGRGYLVLKDISLPLADHRSHAACSGSDSSIIHFVSFPSVRNSAL